MGGQPEAASARRSLLQRQPARAILKNKRRTLGVWLGLVNMLHLSVPVSDLPGSLSACTWHAAEDALPDSICHIEPH